MFAFLKASQLISKKKIDGCGMIRSSSFESYSYYERMDGEVKPLIVHPSNFRHEILINMKKAKKKIDVKFDYLNEENFEAILNKSGKLLHLSSDDFNQNSVDSLFVEKKQSAESQEIAYEELWNLLNVKGCNYEIVILAIPQSRQLAELFLEVGVKHLICFDLDLDFLEKASLLVHYKVYNVINEFTNWFLSNLFKSHSVEDSFKFAKKDFMSLMNKMLEEIYLNFEYIKESLKIGEGKFII